MKISSPTPEKMPTTWWVETVISANQTRIGVWNVCWVDINIFSAFEQEYVFDAKDGHTEIMPVRLQMWNWGKKGSVDEIEVICKNSTSLPNH